MLSPPGDDVRRAIGGSPVHRKIAVLLLIGIAAAASLACLALTGAFDGGDYDSPEAAQTADALQTMVHATMASLPQATKDPNYTPRQSCPGDLATPGIVHQDSLHWPPPDFKGGVTDKATAIGSNGIGYSIVAGVAERDGSQWSIRTRPVYPDYCAVLNGLAPEIETGWYEVGPGPVALTNIDGDTIVFQTGDGKTGLLNYVTGIITSVDGTPIPTAAPTTPTFAPTAGATAIVAQ
jgi:hypothetical protein